MESSLPVNRQLRFDADNMPVTPLHQAPPLRKLAGLFLSDEAKPAELSAASKLFNKTSSLYFNKENYFQNSA
jgi:hypothetical protein